MIDYSKLPLRVQNNLHERGVSPERVTRMRPHEVLKEYLEWEGLIGWSSDIYSVVHAIDAATTTTKGTP